MVALCRRLGVSRQCGYKWWRRFCEGGGLQDDSRRPKSAERKYRRWYQRVLELRRQYPHCGGEKLRWHLEQRYRLGPWPAVRTLERWLRAAGVVSTRKRRSRVGPTVVSPAVFAVRKPNDMWTVDFKGWFNTADGHRVCALTVRDLFSRYVLLVRHVARADERRVLALMRGLFRKYGVPRAIRVDNGPPFGAVGPRGWSGLAVTWIRLGVQVEYGRPGRPQDNAEHEQMHQVLKKQTASPPAANLAAQQRRFNRWRELYNCRRPHRALQMQVPHAVYHDHDRRAPWDPPAWTYPTSCHVVRADPRGRCRWAGRRRLIGGAFRHQLLGLRPISSAVAEVFFGPHLLGELHADDCTGLRAVQLSHRPRNRMPIH